MALNAQVPLLQIVLKFTLVILVRLWMF